MRLGVLWYRLAVAAAVLLLGWQSVAATMANVTRRVRPSAALQVQPFDAMAKAQLAAFTLLDTRQRPQTELVERLSREALQRDPTVAGAARSLALVEDLRGNRAGALRLMQYSEALTRRDPLTQLWLIEYFVQRNDVPQVLRRFEAAASTSPETMPILFPILVNALNQGDLVAPIADMLARDPWWTPSLLQAMAAETRSTNNVAALFIRLARSGHPPRADIVATLASRLEREGNGRRAAQLRQLPAPDAPAQTSLNP